jgi:hypothetical protein
VKSKRSLLTVAALVAGGVVLYAIKDSFAKPPIQISHRFDMAGGRFTQAPGTVPLFFELTRPLKLTSVEVFLLSDLQTNKAPEAYWHLVSDSNSVPTKGFLYGMTIPGMRAAAGTTNALELGAEYRLVIEAGSLKAQHDFALEPLTP